ncbi:Flavodoxin 1 [Chitinispirillum alkaliphilum]|nr:Flavodoxin 1 [Chitinispirillum alkaliphilum]
MTKTAVIYGSTTGNTKAAAERIAQLIGDADIKDIAQSSVEEIAAYSNIILGSSTWGYGDVQDDWESVVDSLSAVDLSGKKVALFGTGDQSGYPDTFVDALGILYDAVVASGAEVIGMWSSDGYEFEESKGKKDGMLVGLALDDDNQAAMTDDRIEMWVKQIKPQLL